MATSIVQFRVDDDLKAKSDALFKDLGIGNRSVDCNENVFKEISYCERYPV